MGKYANKPSTRILLIILGITVTVLNIALLGTLLF